MVAIDTVMNQLKFNMSLRMSVSNCLLAIALTIPIYQSNHNRYVFLFISIEMRWPGKMGKLNKMMKELCLTPLTTLNLFMLY